MDKREAKRRARWAAANIVEGAIDSGWQTYDLTDDGSDEQNEQIVDATKEIVREIRRRLPPGYVPSTHER